VRLKDQIFILLSVGGYNAPIVVAEILFLAQTRLSGKRGVGGRVHDDLKIEWSLVGEGRGRGSRSRVLYTDGIGAMSSCMSDNKWSSLIPCCMCTHHLGTGNDPNQC
jgi:hypothetical protein